MRFLNYLCLVLKKTLDTEALRRVSKIKHSAKKPFAECFFYRVFFVWQSAKNLFAQCLKKNTRQIIWLSAKSRIPVVDTIAPFSLGSNG
jgi:hypothetical protein